MYIRIICINICINIVYIYINCVLYIYIFKLYFIIKNILYFSKKLKNYIIQKIYKRYKKILKTIYFINATIIATIRTEYGFEITTQNQSIQVPEVEASVTFDNCN